MTLPQILFGVPPIGEAQRPRTLAFEKELAAARAELRQLEKADLAEGSLTRRERNDGRHQYLSAMTYLMFGIEGRNWLMVEMGFAMLLDGKFHVRSTRPAKKKSL